MEKTIEEMKAATLAECERLCHAEGITADFGWMKVVAVSKIRVPRWKILIGAHPLVTVSAEMDDDVTELAYRLLDLKTRDAVESKINELAESEIAFERQANILQAERAKTAKLVEFATKVADLFKGKGLGNDASEALEAYKKGGSNG